MSERAGIFDDATDFDVSAFAPVKTKTKTGTTAEAVRAIAEKSDFRSREPAPPKAKKETPARERRRYTTGRNQQINLKARGETLDAFYAIANAQNWVLGETLERAVAALQKELGMKPGQGL
jgi:hypothetical protein